MGHGINPNRPLFYCLNGARRGDTKSTFLVREKGVGLKTRRTLRDLIFNFTWQLLCLLDINPINKINAAHGITMV